MQNLVASDIGGFLAAHFGITQAFLVPALIVLALWTIALKGFALWHAARNSQKYWFIVVLVINTFGLLEIAYLIWFRRDRSNITPSLFEEPIDGTVPEPSAETR